MKKIIFLITIITLSFSCSRDSNSSNNNSSNGNVNYNFIIKKYLYLLLLLLPLKFYSQNTITINDIELLTNKNSNQFENWAINKGYSFDKLKNYSEFFDALYFKKKSSMLITTINKDGTPFGGVSFQTSNYKEYMNLKQSCLKNGYSYVGSEKVDDEGRYVIIHTYKKLNFELTFNVNDTTIYYGYNISLRKL
jgi:hypothetical protein